jgi:hypothetical protein
MKNAERIQRDRDWGDILIRPYDIQAAGRLWINL